MTVKIVLRSQLKEITKVVNQGRLERANVQLIMLDHFGRPNAWPLKRKDDAELMLQLIQF